MRRILIIILVIAFSMLTDNAFAADYSQYTTEELANMRGTMQDASEEERVVLVTHSMQTSLYR